MNQLDRLFGAVRERFSAAKLKDSVAAKPLSAGDQHVLVLSEISMAFGAGGGTGQSGVKQPAKGAGGGGGGGAKATPVAVLVVEQGKARIERIGS
jgi:uncharacterized spore protein YtfJ